MKKLRQIQKLLGIRNLKGILLKDYDDIQSESNEEKLNRFVSLVNFVIMENSVPSGHIDELKILSFLRIITCVLNLNGIGATWMQSDYENDFNFIKFFRYDKLDLKLIDEITNWGFDKIEKRNVALNKLYTWRK